ncbi:acyltransferase family protein [Bifidobacterium oedipodis]|uniref:Acyltransferase domain-containing protein n=1 Tax=Bifidobacterium oedipodis TaxID=2675322 RepID=A0A7Y0EN80_9BIFI|nr:acyltransferase family protein [Bifidobacterium sp. DSM 109957]NMM93340.1 acyltransferase domain-containing protein [Bifidobacterium sp. DSM 109957]
MLHGPISSAQAQPHAPRPPRRLSVEVLRLCAIIGIAVFHTFSASFHHIAACLPSVHQAAAACGTMAALAAQPASLWPLSVMMTLGSWGNHVFFMISGFFLVASAYGKAGEPRFWRSQYRSVARRVCTVMLTIAFYALLCRIVDQWIVPVPAVHQPSRWITGLEFVWLYCLFTTLAPPMGWLLHRLDGCRQTVRRAALVTALAIMALTYALNIVVAATASAPGISFALSDWRKWMSAITYMQSFLLAGCIGVTRQHASNAISSTTTTPAALRDDINTSAFLTRRCRLTMLLLCAAMIGIAYAVALALPNPTLLTAISFKSTSLLSFLLALSALLLAIGPVQPAPPAPVYTPTVGAIHHMVTAMASGIIGFYIIQSVTTELWEPIAHAVAAPPATVGTAALWYGSGILFSLALVVLACLCDRLIRRPLFMLIHLAK